MNNSTGDVRFEAEGGYHAFALDSITAGGVTTNKPNGDMKAETLMANAFYDLHTGSRFTPYIGAGIGEGHLQFPKNKGLTNTSDSDNVLAYQGMVGVSYTPESMPNTDLALGYRYLGFGKPSFNTPTGSTELSHVHENDVEFSFRYHF